MSKQQELFGTTRDSTSPRGVTLAEASEAYWIAADKGGSICPCCDRFGKKYKRALNSTMASSLIWLVRAFREGGNQWVDVPNTAPKSVLRTNQLSTLKYWRLVEQMKNERAQVKCSGIWRPTDLGIAFVNRLAKVPSYIWHYNDEVLGVSKETTSIGEALGERFNYEAIMSARLNDDAAFTPAKRRSEP